MKWLKYLCLSVPLTVFGVVDAIQFGVPASENEHALNATLSDVVEGNLGEPARRLLPPEERGWRGGRLMFTMKVDPERPNYFTAKFWGGDVAGEEERESRICLFMNGKQIGHRQLGEIEMLDIMWHEMPRFPGRFFYKTIPLPFHMTKGETEVEIAIEAQGGINGYTKTIEQYQRMMTEPSRGIYRGYVHTNPCFEPLEGETQGAVSDFPVRPEPGAEVLDELKEQLNNLTDQLFNVKKKMHQDVIQYLAHAYQVPWNKAYHNSTVLERIVEALDAEYLEYRDNPKVLNKIHWVGKGAAADAVRVVCNELKPYLNEKVDGTKIVRRKAWAELVIASRNFNVARRRSLSNQSMIVDLNIYRCNVAARILGSSEAWPEKKARLLLYESAGLEPWSGSWDEEARPSWSHGKKHLLLSREGLTRELGYVGGYGEIVIDLVKAMYDLTKPAPDEAGDARLKQQLIKMTRARAPFRYPLADAEGYRSMNAEKVIGWRDWHYPGQVIYDQANGHEGGSFDAALVSKDPVLLGYGQQMLEDNQYFAAVKQRLESRKRAQAGTSLLSVPQDYETMKNLPEFPHRLPMTKGAPDSVFSDTDNGVVAVKNGDDILYVSLYWRARFAINNLARVHYMTPEIERDATVNIETRFNDSGHVYTVPDWTNSGLKRGREEAYYRNLGMHLADAGQERPIAVVPDKNEMYQVGNEHPCAGKANLYLMSYGAYFVAMNCTEDESYQFDLPAGFKGARDLVSGQVCNISNVKISPLQTIVFYLEQ